METILVSMETKAGQKVELKRRGAVNLELHLGYWLRRVSNHVSGAFARALQKRQTSVAEWVVLSHVQAHPGTTPGDLADALNLTRGAISKVLVKLEAKEWITRTSKLNDSRVQLLSLTPSGTRVLPQLAEIADENDRAFFAGLTAQEQDTLRRILTKLVRLHEISEVPTK